MNKIFKVIWSKSRNCYVVASELAKGTSKSTSTGRMAKRAALAAVAALLISPLGAGYVSAADGYVTVKDTNGTEQTVYTKDGVDAQLGEYAKNTTVSQNTSDISELKTADTILQKAIDEEARKRKYSVTNLENADKQLQTNIDNEAAVREAADMALDTRITNVKEYLQQEAADTYVSKTDAAVQDGAVVKAANTIGENVTNLDAALAKETAARIGADAAQDKVIEQVNQNMVDGFNTINKNMADGFTALNQADANEAAAREAADTTLQTNIDNEAAERKAADTVLDDKITAETSARVAADTKLVEAVNSGLSLSNDNVLQKNTTTIDAQGNVTTSKTDANEMILNKGKDNQITLNENGIKVGTNSTVVDKDGVYTGGDTYSEAKAALKSDGSIKGADGKFTVNSANGTVNVNDQIELNGATGVVKSNGLNVGDGNMTVSNNGNINTVGTLSVADGNFKVNSSGGVTAAGGKTTLASDGSIKAADGKFTVNSNGGVKAADGKITLSSDGSVKAADGKFTVNSNGAVKAANGNTTIDSNGNLKTAGTLSAADGSFKVDSNGKITSTGLDAGNGTIQTTGAVKAGDVQTGTLETTGDATIGGNLTVDKNLTVNGEFNAKTLSSKLDENNYTTITGGKTQSVNLKMDTATGETKASASTFDETGSNMWAKDDDSIGKSTVTADGISQKLSDTGDNPTAYAESTMSQGTDNKYTMTDTVKDGDKTNVASQSATESSDVVTDANGNTSTFRQRVDAILQEINNADGDTLTKVEQTDTAITSQIGDGSAIKSVMNADGIANTATGKSITNDAADIINTGTDSVTNQVGSNKIVVDTTGVKSAYGDNTYTTWNAEGITNSTDGNMTNTVGGEMKTTVTGKVTEDYKSDLDTKVGGTLTETVTGKATENYNGGLETTITGEEKHTVNGNQINNITGDQTNTITGKQSTTVTGDVTEDYKANLSTTVGGNQTTTVTGDSSLTAENITNEAKNKITNKAIDVETDATSSIVQKVTNDAGSNTSTQLSYQTKEEMSQADGKTASYLRGAAEEKSQLIDGDKKTTIDTVAGQTNTNITDGTNTSNDLQKADQIASSVTDGTNTTVVNQDAKSLASSITDGTKSNNTNNTVDKSEQLIKASDTQYNASVKTATTSTEKLVSGSIIDILKDADNGFVNTTVSTSDGTSSTSVSQGSADITNTAKQGTITNDAKNLVNKAEEKLSNSAAEIENTATTSIKDTVGKSTVTTTTDGTTFENTDHNTAIGDGSITKTTISGNTLETGKATMDYAEVMKDLTVGGTTTTKDLHVTNNATIDGTLDVTGAANFQDTVTVAKDLSVGGNASVSGSMTASSYKVGDKTYIDDNGINANNQKITNVAAGELSANSLDAVNGSQLYETNRRVSKMDSRINEVGANAAAMANLHPLEFDADSKFNVAAAVGNYKNETATALGLFYRPNEDVMVNLSGTVGSDDNMIGGGVAVRIGRGGNKARNKQMAESAKYVKNLESQVNTLQHQMDALLSVLNPNLSKEFPDVPENHWAYEAVSRLAGNGIIQGYEDGKYHGERTMTRYEMAEIIYKALQKGAKAEAKLVEEFKPELKAMAAQNKA